MRPRVGVSGLIVGGRVVASNTREGGTIPRDLESASISESTIPGTFSTISGLSLPVMASFVHAAIVVDNAAWLIGGYTTGTVVAPQNTRIDLR